MNHQVRRGCNEGKQTHATGKCQRHQQTARIQVGTSRQTHHDRKHQRYRTRITDKTTDTCGHQHDQQEESGFTIARQLQDTGTDHLGQACLKDRTTYDKQTDHHNHYRIGKAGQGFGRSQNLKNKKSAQGTQGYNVRTDFTNSKQSRRNHKNSYRYPHKMYFI